MLRVLYGYIDTLAYLQLRMRWTKGLSPAVLNDKLHYLEWGPAYFDRIGWPRIVRLWARGAAAELALLCVTRQQKLKSLAAAQHLLREARRWFPDAEKIFWSLSPITRAVAVLRRYRRFYSLPKERVEQAREELRCIARQWPEERAQEATKAYLIECVRRILVSDMAENPARLAPAARHYFAAFRRGRQGGPSAELAEARLAALGGRPQDLSDVELTARLARIFEAEAHTRDRLTAALSGTALESVFHSRN